MIPFNKPYLTGKEIQYINDAVASGKISGNGKYTQLCHSYFEKNYGFNKCLLTTSCTDALEMAAILINTKPGDEVIVPSYTFVSTSNAFVLRGAKIVFADSNKENPNIDTTKLESLITSKTKAIVPVHYAGMACDMDIIMELAFKYNLFVIEDAAQAIDSYYISKAGEKKALGSIGHLGAFSFHETKNIISGEGGMLAINDMQFAERAEIIWEKGTNRSAFFRGDVNKYSWVDIGSSYLPSDLLAAFLLSQLESLDEIQEKRKALWNRYYDNLYILYEKDILNLPQVPDYATNNAHMFYLICDNLNVRQKIIEHLRLNGVLSVFHYISLHKSLFNMNNLPIPNLPNADQYTDCLLKLPLYVELGLGQVDYISNKIKELFI